MPWKVEERDGKFCVISKTDGGLVKCHASESDAQAHARALYANVEEKSLGLKLLGLIKSIVGMETQVPPLMISKNANGYTWVARYSNNLRDDDQPSDILSAKSHERFVALVDAGVAPMPELWVWHNPAWRWGQADWLAYDDSGFPMAGGHVLEGREFIAEAFMQAKGLKVSHGMPPWSVRRSSEDPSVIEEYITIEISPLPDWAAANKATGFFLDKKENDEMLDPTVKKQLMDKHGISTELLNRLEQLNLSDAQVAKLAGVQSKDASELVVPEGETEAPKAEVVAKEQAVEEKSTTGVSEEVLTSVILAVTKLGENLQATANAVKELGNRVDDMTVARADEMKQKAARAPIASLAEAMVASVIGLEATKVDGRSVLAKSGPVETKPETRGATPFPMINQWVGQPRQEN